MVAFFLIVLGVPLAIAAFAFVFLNGITWKEFSLIIFVQLLVAGSSAGIVSCSNTRDTEIWNGRVAKKYSHHVSCSHSYTCNCRTTCSGSGKNQSCSTICDTCYEHFYDVSWTVDDTIGQSWNISRVDRQGLSEPPRFTAVQIGEPTSGDHPYVNYVKASPGSLFRHQGLKEKYSATLPNYPHRMYDYWHVDRFVSVGVDVPEGRASWNSELANLNGDLGHTKQANVIIVLVRNQPQEWFYALEEKWIGGKKNDVVLVVSVDAEMKPQWASVMCWTTNEFFKVKLRDDIMSRPILNRDLVFVDLRTSIAQNFVRKPMKDFEYLSSAITPSATQWVITLIVGLLFAIVLIIFFEVNDVFDEERFNSFKRQNKSKNFKIKKPSFRNPFKRFYNTRPWEDVC